MKFQTKNWDIIQTILRWFIALVFIYAGVGKILDPASFAEDIDNYRILPYILVTVMAAILPWLEALCGILLIIKKLQRGAAFTILILCFVFFIAISSAVIRGLDITCGCFAGTDEGAKIGYIRLVEEFIFFVIAFFVYIKLENFSNFKLTALSNL